MSMVNGSHDAGDAPEPEPVAPAPDEPVLPCSIAAHRGDRWRLAAGGPIVCSKCHPPAPGLDVERLEGRSN
jgi:hypothetical protein